MMGGGDFGKIKKTHWPSSEEENKEIYQQVGQEKNNQLGLDALHMNMHSFSIQFRYKPLMILTWPHAKSRKKKIPASPSMKKNYRQVAEEKNYQQVRQEKIPQPVGQEKKTHREFSARASP